LLAEGGQGGRFLRKLREEMLVGTAKNRAKQDELTKMHEREVFELRRLVGG
jgi:hypothetical protein